MIRTRDIFLGKEVLYQLSYTRISKGRHLSKAAGSWQGIFADFFRTLQGLAWNPGFGPWGGDRAVCDRAVRSWNRGIAAAEAAERAERVAPGLGVGAEGVPIRREEVVDDEEGEGDRTPEERRSEVSFPRNQDFKPKDFYQNYV